MILFITNSIRDIQIISSCNLVIQYDFPASLMESLLFINRSVFENSKYVILHSDNENNKGTSKQSMNLF